jgi:hypothetical protein
MINELRPICQEDNIQKFILMAPSLSQALLDTAFEIACYNGGITIFKYLIENYHISKAAYQIGFSHMAKTNQVTLLNYMFEEDISYENLEQSRYELFILCIAYNQEIVKSLAYKNPSFIKRDNFRAFHVAYLNKHYNMFAFFIVNDFISLSDIENKLEENHVCNPEVLILFSIKDLEQKLQKELSLTEEKDSLQKL